MVVFFSLSAAYAFWFKGLASLLSFGIHVISFLVFRSLSTAHTAGLGPAILLRGLLDQSRRTINLQRGLYREWHRYSRTEFHGSVGNWFRRRSSYAPFQKEIALPSVKPSLKARIQEEEKCQPISTARPFISYINQLVKKFPGCFCNVDLIFSEEGDCQRVIHGVVGFILRIGDGERNDFVRGICFCPDISS